MERLSESLFDPGRGFGRNRLYDVQQILRLRNVTQNMNHAPHDPALARTDDDAVFQPAYATVFEVNQESADEASRFMRFRSVR